MFDKGFFGDLFDFDGDGKLNSIERAMDFALFDELTKEENEEDEQH